MMPANNLQTLKAHTHIRNGAVSSIVTPNTTVLYNDVLLFYQVFLNSHPLH